MQCSKNRTYAQLDKWLTLRDHRKFWSMIRVFKNSNIATTTQDININTLTSHFMNKCSSMSTSVTDTISQAHQDVRNNSDLLRGSVFSASDHLMTKQMLCSYIKPDHLDQVVLLATMVFSLNTLNMPYM